MPWFEWPRRSGPLPRPERQRCCSNGWRGRNRTLDQHGGPGRFKLGDSPGAETEHSADLRLSHAVGTELGDRLTTESRADRGALGSQITSGPLAFARVADPSTLIEDCGEGS